MSNDKQQININGNGVTQIGDNSVTNSPGSAVGPGASVTHLISENGETISQEIFNEGVTQILHALVGLRDQIDRKHRNLVTNFFNLVDDLKVENKKVADIQNMIETLWIDNEMEKCKPILQKLFSSQSLGNGLIGATMGTVLSKLLV